MSKNDENWTVDWDKVDDKPPPPLEDAIYRGRITSAEQRRTNDDVQGCKVELSAISVVTESGDTALDAPRRVYETLVFSAGALFRTKQLCNASGAEPPKSFKDNDVSDFAISLVGLDVCFRTRRQTWNGKVNAKVERYIREDQLAAALSGKLDAADAESAAAPAAGGRKRRRAA